MGKNAITVLNEGKASIDEINGKLQQTIQNVLAINDAALKVGKNFFNIKSPKDLNGALEKNKTFVKQLNTELQERKRLEKALETQLERNRQAESENAKALSKARFEQTQLNIKNKEAAILSSKLSTEYKKQSTILIQLRRKYKDVALTQGESSKAAKQLVVQITALDNRLKRVDANVGQFQRSVGNYSKAMRGAMGAARSLAGAMGLLGGAFLVVRVFSDAFKRIREFDSEMQNLAGIMRTTRPEIKLLEDRIIAIASSSVRTSTEVSELATNLAKLGKRGDDLLNLLEPANNLSIGLRTTSADAGEFLVQTLNAFGAGSEEGLAYADTIATIAQTTSLDFQKMRDSFQYLTPVSRILNKDLAYTGALLGVVADSGIKAEQAGRLLASGQLRLAKSGKTLVEGITEINDAIKAGKTEIEVLGLTTEVFGVNAAKAGVALALAFDKLPQYEDSIRGASGALDDLVNEQLKSVDAQLKITTSVWEEFVLSIDNGKGSLSIALGSALGFFNDIIKGLTLMNKTTEEYNEYLKKDVVNKTLKEVSAAYKDLGDDAEALAIQEADASRDKVDAIEKEIKALKEKNKELKGESNFGTGFRKSASVLSAGVVDYENPEIKENEKRITELTTSVGYYTGVLKASEAVISQTDESQKHLNETNTSAEEGNIKNISALREKIKLERENIENIDLELYSNKAIIKEKQDLISKYQAEIDAILGVNKARKQGIIAVKGSMAFLKNEISVLEEKREKLAKTTKEYERYTRKIELAEKALKDFKLELQGVSEIKSLGDAEKSLERITDILTNKEIEGIENSGLDDIQNFIDAEDRKQEKARETAEYRKQLELDLAYALVDFTNTIFDAKVQKYDDEIQKNNDKYASLLDNEKISEEQRSALEAERDRKNSEIEKKKRKEQKKQALFNKAVSLVEIGINTAIGVSKAIAASPLTLGLPWSAIIATLGAVQAATVIATPIPAYKDGKKQGEGKDSIALLNDGGKDELKISSNGEMQRVKGRNVLSPVLKSDTIIPDADKFLSNLSDKELYNNLHKHTILASMAHQKNTIDSYLIAQSMDKSFEKHTNRMIEAMGKNRPKINLHNNNNIGEDLKFLSELSKL